jgi:hypothetical protein
LNRAYPALGNQQVRPVALSIRPWTLQLIHGILNCKRQRQLYNCLYNRWPTGSCKKPQKLSRPLLSTQQLLAYTSYILLLWNGLHGHPPPIDSSL